MGRAKGKPCMFSNKERQGNPPNKLPPLFRWDVEIALPMVSMERNNRKEKKDGREPGLVALGWLHATGLFGMGCWLSQVTQVCSEHVRDKVATSQHCGGLR